MSTKDQILHAAGRIVLERGLTGLTLETVAEAADLSKGGLLYHYSSKEALVVAMVERLIEVTDEQIRAHQQSDQADGSWTRGYLRTCAVQPDDPNGRLAAAVMAAGASDPSLLDALREHEGVWHDALTSDGVDATTVNLVRLAADGLWMNDIFGLPVLSDEERQAVIERLEQMTRG